MSNDTQCNVAHIGTVRIKTYDGIVRTLCKVCHIPELKHNLISLGTLESNECKYSAEGGVLKISKSTLVLRKGEIRGSLYVLQGSTGIGSASASTTSSVEDHTRLWHARLGHI